LCKFCIGAKADWVCLKKADHGKKDFRVINHRQAEECADYEKKG
jgi:hypothetical protein